MCACCRARFERFYRKGESDALDAYSATALRRVWKGQRFSYWMTSMLHRFDGEYAEFDMKRQLAELDYVTCRRPPPFRWRRTTPGCRSIRG